MPLRLMPSSRVGAMRPISSAGMTCRRLAQRSKSACICAVFQAITMLAIERLFAWEDKFRRLLLRFERLSQLHYAFETIAYPMINLRHYCRGAIHGRAMCVNWRT
jgi:hypothetical protein